MYRLPDGYRENLTPEPYNDAVGGVIWQPEVYRIASELAVEHACDTIIDVGCGSARKAVATGLKVIGIDRPEIGPGLDVIFVGCNLEAGMPDLDVDYASSVIVCADVIEHLINPGRLLSDLAQICEKSPVLLISTPDRDLVRGPEDLGPPANACHVREWNEPEFRALLSDYQIPAEVLHTIDNDLALRPWTLLAVVERA